MPPTSDDTRVPTGPLGAPAFCAWPASVTTVSASTGASFWPTTVIRLVAVLPSLLLESLTTAPMLLVPRVPPTLGSSPVFL